MANYLEIRAVRRLLLGLPVGIGASNPSHSEYFLAHFPVSWENVLLFPKYSGQGNCLHPRCRVCQQWHQLYAPLLWGNPASFFGTDSDSVYCQYPHVPFSAPSQRLCSFPCQKSSISLLGNTRKMLRDSSTCIWAFNIVISMAVP